MAKRTKVSIGEWAKHLRPYLKRVFWKKDRKAGKREERDRPDDRPDYRPEGWS